MAKPSNKGRYITKIGFYDIYAKDAMKSKGRDDFSKPEVASTTYNVYKGKKIVSNGHKTKDLAVIESKKLLGETFCQIHNIK